MKKKIFYFSGSGNTLKLARDLAKEAGGFELVKISYSMEYDQRDCDVAGIACPVYCFVQPNIVVDFISKVKFSGTAYIFGLFSYGAMLTSSGRYLKKLLEQRGYTLNAGFAIRMPGNATTVYNVIKPEKQKAMFKKAQARIPEIAKIIGNRAPYGIDTNLGILGRIATLLGPSMMKGIPGSDKAFFTDANCDGCGICQKVCPVGNIVMSGGKPQWQHKCECCMACFHWCPKAAIQGSEKTKLRGRYHQPDITLADMTRPQAALPGK
jgi:ferredoxin